MLFSGTILFGKGSLHDYRNLAIVLCLPKLDRMFFIHWEILITMLLEQILTTITLDQPIPNAKTIFSFKIPDQKSGKVVPFPSNQRLSFVINLQTIDYL